MNGTFNAFQMSQRPEVTSYRKHIRLKKRINLPDDTLEYWGFYLLKGATVILSVCSRFEGASILVVRGEKNLRTCGLLDHSNEKDQNIFLPGSNKQVKVIYESNAQEINSNELIEPINAHNINDLQPLVSTNSEDPLRRIFETSTNMYNSTQSYNATVERDLEILYNIAASYVHKHKDGQRTTITNDTRKLRHIMNRHHNTKERKNKKMRQKKKRVKNQIREMRVQKLKQKLYAVNEKGADVQPTKIENTKLNAHRVRRSRKLIKPPSLLDQGIRHGGNADKNMSNSNDVSSVSSFEYGLFNCYGGDILLAHEFEPSHQCLDIDYLLSGKHMQTSHHVEENGYYYYIFYNDNDITSNDIYALFDIYKPTFQYENVTKSCINQTKCSFSLNILSPDRVIVEIPTKDGIEHDEMNDVNMLISSCHPRMGIYFIFPLTVLLLVLGCAFM